MSVAELEDANAKGFVAEWNLNPSMCVVGDVSLVANALVMRTSVRCR